MLRLPNHCRAGKFSVRPANWKSQSAKVNTIWSISYWFYDDNLQQKKKIVIKGGNRHTTLKEKQDHTRNMIDFEMDLVKEKGYNPITKSYAVISESEISGSTTVLSALEYAKTKLDVQPNTLKYVNSCLNQVKKAVAALRLERMPASDIRRRHIKAILEECGKGKGWEGNSSYNHYRSYLLMLFKELVERDIIDTNPVRDISKKKGLRKIRKELTKKERGSSREFLSNKYPEFWRFVNIFFHSGARISELMGVKKSDVDLSQQQFKVLIKKGQDMREVYKPIKDVVMGDWKELLESAKPGDYLFSRGLKPGKSRIRPEHVTRRWKNHVKIKLGIAADLYSLKHSNLDEISGALAAHEKGIKGASEAAGHSTPVITMDVYAQGEKERRNKTIREVANEF